MRKYLLILSIFILIIGIILICFLVLRNEKEWPIYENSRYNFSLKYPPEWKLGEKEINNAGREFNSQDGKVYCYAYGFQNAIFTQNNRPQTLDEFIEWMKDKPDFELIEQKETSLGGYRAIELVSRTDGKIKQAVYALGNETGRGFFCVFGDLREKKNFEKDFDRIKKSFKISVSLDKETERCENLLTGLVVPLRDFQSFEDENYSEVVMTSRDYWDKERLPEKVVEMEEKGYFCSPEVSEFKNSPKELGMHIEPEIKKVKWSCEQEFAKWTYLDRDELKKKEDLEKEGCICEKQDCLDKEGKINFIWFCYK